MISKHQQLVVDLNGFIADLETMKQLAEARAKDSTRADLARGVSEGTASAYTYVQVSLRNMVGRESKEEHNNILCHIIGHKWMHTATRDDQPSCGYRETVHTLMRACLRCGQPNPNFEPKP